MATGIYFRVVREGKWVNLEIENLTREERETCLAGRGPAWVNALIDMLCEEILRLEKEQEENRDGSE